MTERMWRSVRRIKAATSIPSNTLHRRSAKLPANQGVIQLPHDRRSGRDGRMSGDFRIAESGKARRCARLNSRCPAVFKLALVLN